MTPNSFNALDYTRKTETVLKSVFLADRRSAHAYVKLYSCDNFYIEVFFDNCSHLITHFRAFQHTRWVLPYLKELRIPITGNLPETNKIKRGKF